MKSKYPKIFEPITSKAHDNQEPYCHDADGYQLWRDER